MMKLILFERRRSTACRCHWTICGTISHDHCHGYRLLLGMTLILHIMHAFPFPFLLHSLYFLLHSFIARSVHFSISLNFQIIRFSTAPAAPFIINISTYSIINMFFSVSLASTVLLASNVLAQYGGGYNYDSGSGSSQSDGSKSGAGSSSTSMSKTGSEAASPAAAGAASPSGQVMVHVVKVSNKMGALTFEPNNLQVPAGDMVQFHFYPKVSTRKQPFLQSAPTESVGRTESQRRPIYF